MSHEPFEDSRRLTGANLYFDGAGASLDDVSIYAWKEARGEVRIVNFRLGSRAFSQPLGLRQYWQKTASGWKILSEDTL